MNCKKYQAQIEELMSRQAVSSEVLRHLEHCVDCRDLSRECEKLGAMLDCLKTVAAPNDFNFHLKARLKRGQQPASVWTWQRLAGGTTAATLAALAVGFVLMNNSSPATQTAQANVNSNQTITVQQVQQIDRAIIAETVTPIEQTLVETPREIVRRVDRTNSYLARRENIKTVQRRVQPKNSNEEILVRDSADGGSADTLLSPAPQVMPRGIPDPLREPKKQDAREILKTLGVETENTSEGLRVKKSNRVDLQTDDVIQLVNGENPAAVTGGKLEEIKLTVRRKEQIREVKILAKP